MLCTARKENAGKISNLRFCVVLQYAYYVDCFRNTIITLKLVSCFTTQSGLFRTNPKIQTLINPGTASIFISDCNSLWEIWNIPFCITFL